MKVTFLCPHLGIAGGVRAILTYAERLAGRGYAVTVVVPAKSRVRALVRSLRRAGPAWIPGFRPRVQWVARWRGDRLPDADAVIATAWQSAAPVAAAPVRCGRKFYLIQHYESLYHGSADAVDATYRLPLAKIVISTWLRDIMREQFASDAAVLVTPVDLAFFRPEAVSVTTPRPRVLMLHHGYDWKGVADGLDAVTWVKRAVPSLTLVGFGLRRPPPPQAYDEFHLNPPQRHLASIYSSCDIYLCPSWDEGLGMPSMEAMACGAALVTYDNGGCRDYARDGETALVAHRRDVGDLARKLQRLAADEALRRRIAAAGQNLVTTAFAWDRAVAKLEALIAKPEP